jgi:hypothetical protein
MILEEIDGDVVVTMMKENGAKATVAIGDYISDHESSTITVIGTGKAIVRVDPSCTFEIKGVAQEGEVSAPAPTPEPTPKPTPTPVEAAPVAEVVAPAVETPSAPAEEVAKK